MRYVSRVRAFPTSFFWFPDIFSEPLSFPGETQCGICHPGFHLENDQCLPNICTCQHGAAVASENCFAHTQESCASCPEDINEIEIELVAGFPVMICSPICQDYETLENYLTCVPNTCTCEFGQAVLAVDCLVNQQEKCLTCNSGYYLNDDEICMEHNCQDTQYFDTTTNSCADNICTCQFGQVAEFCLVNGSEACQPDSCQAGYDFLNGICAPKPCNCQNGVCQRGETTCSSCADSFHLNCDSDTLVCTCRPNECYCQNGQPVESEDCLEHNSEHCATCTDETFELVNQICESAANKNLPTCDLAFNHLEDGQCLPNTCLCINGVPKPAGKCPAHNTYDCDICFENYTTNQKIMPHPTEPGKNFKADYCNFKCLCPDGAADPDPNACSIHSPVKCLASRCNNGYHFDFYSNICVPNICTCLHGTPKTPCLLHDNEQCSDCQTGYILSLGVCRDAAAVRELDGKNKNSSGRILFSVSMMSMVVFSLFLE